LRLLVAEDEKDLLKALTCILKHNNYSVDGVSNGQDALDYALSGNYDGIILDIMMPKMDGLTVLRSLRSGGVRTPVLMLTARSQTCDLVEGLNAGADDYLRKPFIMDEFLARVNALIRRGAQFIPSEMVFGNISLDRSTFELCGPLSNVRLINKEFQMMELLIRRSGRLISTEQFMDMVWGFESEAELNVVWAYISYLRRKLEAVGANVEISLIRGQGYILSLKDQKEGPVK